MNSSDGCKTVTPEDLIRCTKAITKATAKSVAAGISNKQDDIIAAANMSRSAIFDMLYICKVILVFQASKPFNSFRNVISVFTLLPDIFKIV